MKNFKNLVIYPIVGAAASALAITLGTSSVQAQTTKLNLFSTGQATNYYATSQSQFSSGVADSYWEILSTPSSTTPTSSLVTTPNSAWVANTTASQWISNVADSTAGTSAAGNYDFETSFNIPTNVLLSTVQIQFVFTSDNSTTAVLFNGASTGISNTGAFNAFSTTQTINSSDAALHAGTNTIDFIVNNGGTTANPMGLNVQFTSATGATAPEPGSVGLMLLGMTGMMARCSRLRRRSIA